MSKSRHRLVALAWIFLLACIAAVLCIRATKNAQIASAQPATLPVGLEGAALLYWQASEAMTVDSPSETAKEYPAYPPDSADWQQLEAKAWAANARGRDLVHQATGFDHPNWPAQDEKHMDYLSRFNHIAWGIHDAALYADWQGHPNQAIEMLRDILHASDLLAKDGSNADAWYLSVAGLTRIRAISRNSGNCSWDQIDKGDG